MALEHWAKFHDDDLGRLLKGLGISNDLAGAIDVDLVLSTRGRDFRALLTEGRGQLTIVGGKGKLPSRLLQLWGGDLVNALLPTTLLRKKETDLNCVVARFRIKNGVASSDR